MDTHSPTLNASLPSFLLHSVPQTTPGGQGRSVSQSEELGQAAFPQTLDHRDVSSSHHKHHESGLKVQWDTSAVGGGRGEHEVVSFLSPEACKWKLADCSWGCYWWEIRLSPTSPIGKRKGKDIN